jgi:hypothetical protein
MASKTTQSANDVLNYVLRNAAPSWDGATTLYMSLHVGAVGLGGDQTSNEVSYTGYTRIPLLRNNSTGEFSVSTVASSSNQNLLQFGNATAGSFPITATHAAIGENASSTGTVIATGALASPLVINLNINPQFPIGSAVVQEQ